MATKTKTKAKNPRGNGAGPTPHGVSDDVQNGAPDPEHFAASEASPAFAASDASASQLVAPVKKAKAAVRAKTSDTGRIAERLTDQQLVALSKACQRDDRTLAIPDAVEDEAIGAFAASLIALGLAEEAPAQCGDPVWRQDDATCEPITLRATDRGHLVLGIDDGLETGDASTGGAHEEAAAGSASDEGHVDCADEAARQKPRRRPNLAADMPQAGPRPGSKQSALIAMLSREEGATVSEIATALGWLPHTTRAALTGLRHRGYTLARETGVAERGGVYRITAGPVAPPAVEPSAAAEAA